MGNAKRERAEKIFPESERLSDETLAKLRRVVEEKPGLTQTRIAALTGVRQTAISAWLRGAQRPSAHQLVAVARVANVSLDWLTNDKHRASDWTPGKSTLDVEDVLSQFADQTGLTATEAAEILSARLRSLASKGSHDPPEPTVMGTHDVEPVRRLDRGKAEDSISAGRPLSKKKRS